jgi:hypothetical protein
MNILTKLQPLIDGLPNYDNHYQSFYNIIGVHDKENYNSNVLAYFFNPEVGHGLGTLWIDALLELAQAQGKAQNTADWNFDEVHIRREKSTKDGKRIDLVISGDNWAIIIENKIHHWLHNDLNNYWKSIKKPNKVGLVLSVGQTAIPAKAKDNFINILHTELNEKVKLSLPELGDKPEMEMLRQHIFIHDYFQHINKLYEYQKYQVAMKAHIGDYFTHKAEIEKVVKFRNEAKVALINTVNELMNANGFESPKTHFYPKNKKANKFRFYFKADHLTSGKLSLIFELTGELVASGFGEKICERVNSKWTFNEKAPIGNGHNGKTFFQLGSFWHYPFYPTPEGVNVLDNLIDIIETAYFKVPEGQTLNFVEFCMKELAELTK